MIGAQLTSFLMNSVYSPEGIEGSNDPIISLAFAAPSMRRSTQARARTLAGTMYPSFRSTNSYVRPWPVPVTPPIPMLLVGMTQLMSPMSVEPVLWPLSSILSSPTRATLFSLRTPSSPGLWL